MAGYIAGIGGANVDIHGQSDAPIVMRDSNPGRLHLSAGGVCPQHLRQPVPSGPDGGAVQRCGR